jgi:hypothetical protein
VTDMPCLMNLVHRRMLLRRFRQNLLPAQSYHDESFGFRKPRSFLLPDCESSSILFAVRTHLRPRRMFHAMQPERNGALASDVVQPVNTTNRSR